MNTDKFAEMWRLAAKDLDLEITIPFKLTLSSGYDIEAQLLLKNFGAKNGMIIVNRYDEIENYINEIISNGYGFSVLSQPSENEEYVRNDYVEMLFDWGWCGEEKEKPEWL
jgi:hypothetical protein